MIRTHALASPLLVMLAACAPEPPPAAPASAAPKPAAAPPAEEPRVSARVMTQSPSADSVAYTRLKVVFSNPTSKPCTFTSYTLRWDTASKSFDLASFTVPPGETRERWGRVNPDDAGHGALAKIDVATIRVDVKSDCPAAK